MYAIQFEKPEEGTKSCYAEVCGKVGKLSVTGSMSLTHRQQDVVLHLRSGFGETRPQEVSLRDFNEIQAMCNLLDAVLKEYESKMKEVIEAKP